MQRLLDFNWVEFFKRLYDETFDKDILSRAAQVAFYFTFALFPLLFFLVSLFGMIIESADELRREMFAYLRQVMPYMVFDLVSKTVEEIVEASSSTKLVLGLGVALWSASAGVDTIRTALNAIYGLKEKRTWFRTKLQSLYVTLATIVLIALVLLIVFYGWKLIQTSAAAIGLPVTSHYVLATIQWISILLIMLFACEIIYNLLPDFRPRKWVWLNAGSVVAIIAWLVLTSGFRLYLSYFNSYDRTYGSLGAVIVMMLWLYLAGLVIMVGGLINTVLRTMRANAEKEKADADRLASR